MSPTAMLSDKSIGSGLSLDQALAGHVGRLLDTHDLEDGWSNVTELTVLNLCLLVLGDIDTWNWVE